MDKYKISRSKLNYNFKAEQLDFDTTEELSAIDEEIIGQNRAADSLDFGMRVDKNGYNIFMVGESGTGKSTYAKNMTEEKAAEMEQPKDILYVFNFSEPEEPRVMRVPAGMGNDLKNDMDKIIEELQEEIPRAFEGEEYEKERKEILNEYQPKSNKLMQEFESSAKERGFLLQNTSQGLVPVPIDEDGEPISREDFQEMDEDKKEEIRNESQKIQNEISQVMREIRSIKEKAQDELSALEKKIGISIVQPIICHLKNQYEDCEEIADYLEEVQDDIVDNIDRFRNENDNNQQNPFLAMQQNDDGSFFVRYQINIFVNNSKTDGAPVIYEKNPTYYNLFGKIEGKSQFGTITTNFTMIRSGSLHRANGGFLIVHAKDLLTNPFCWDTLKRALINQEITVENIGEQYRSVPIITLKPEAVELDLKIIMIGSPYIYYLLYNYDDEFSELFKIKADFDTEMTRNKENIAKFADFISSVIKRDQLKEFSSGAVAAMIDFSSRLTGDREKLSTKFNEIIEILYESDVWADSYGEEVVSASSVKKAIDEKEMRSNLLEEKIQEQIDRDHLLLDVSGQEVGQINGLSVYQAGNYSFGRPARITARSYLGKEGVINIEREAKMSGRIHSKGVMILTGYLGGKYAQKTPLSLTASIAFEQSYGGVDGDSATCAEVVALLSSLSGMPIRQDIAITGSMNQKGVIQPIGGVNEKIEGFFKVCQAKGLTGEQGVIIPQRNLDNLMLEEEVIAAVENKEFNLYSIEEIDQALEIMLGEEAEKVHSAVQEKLKEYAEFDSEDIAEDDQEKNEDENE
ncbi:lon-related putative ATP-dependent protease [Halanaerobium congolense]|jgi:lon-related putative ATP-dependent protease|uniref:endopeptidase La n=1 Tax=Halanaerobium congolense TaxID=54121 RepID=A0A1G8JKF1_9FIRM|nr:ATP-binding protein [Halanaerobium congolense]OEG61977.1 MAG: ATP-dependent protease [Halanaerobium sp. MDAL1]PUU93456.1 MAG: sigma-54 interacting domain-containing protein [Halanaerobium sp.]PTX16200.1 lon-related putative ATP-dependent protease [Halanaerobium congolense]PXV60220.1 lon-related putative ATP-dependent protease [Halanaerobium congolense]SDF48802.1 lon-related putative ATP-dependent protease [Halanaerobium congolense]